MSENLTLGTKIRTLRTLRGMSQTKLAHQVGVDRVSISYYENNQQTPKPETLRKIEAAFGCQFDSVAVEAAFVILNSQAARADHVKLALAILASQNGH